MQKIFEKEKKNMSIEIENVPKCGLVFVQIFASQNSVQIRPLLVKSKAILSYSFGFVLVQSFADTIQIFYEGC